MIRIRQIAACLLMWALPLQGFATHALIMPCDGTQSPAAEQSDIHHVGHNAASAGHDHDKSGFTEHQQGSSDTAGSASGHSCCHHASTGVLPATHAGVPETPQVVPGSVQLLTTLFIPELPQRPPRA
jgi:hypothetical protein